MSRLTTWVGGIALALFLLGLSVIPLTVPAFTSIVGSKTSYARQSGLGTQRMARVAEQVRAFVIDGKPDVLPATVDGRPGFDAGAISHLLDVRRVLSGARLVTGILAIVLAIVLAVEGLRKRTGWISDALCAGALMATLFVALGVVAATVNFDWFFTEFHGLFFKAGTWTFDSNSLLIETFPEGFWAIAGAVWGGLVLTGAGVLAFGSCTLKGAQAKGSL